MSDDSILSRARLLSQAANQMASELSGQAEQYKATVNARHQEEANSAEQTAAKKKLEERNRVPRSKDVGQEKVFRGAAINGSTLITTYADMRAFVPRGSSIVIDGITYRLQTNNTAEWSANRIELLEDFKGPTNLDAEIKATVTAEIVKRRSPKKNKAAPVKSGDILSAISNLETSSMLSGRDLPPDPKEYLHSKPSGSNTAQSRKKKDELIPRSKNIKKVAKPDNGSNTSRSEYDTLSTLQTGKSSNSHPLNLNRNPKKSLRKVESKLSPSSSRFNNSVISSPRSMWGGSTTSTASTALPPRSECTHLEEEQYQMMVEMDSLTPEEREQARIEMNQRMADRGQRRANERVEERKRLNLPDTLWEESSQHEHSAGKSSGALSAREEPRGKDVTEEQLAESRREARQRYLQKQKEEEAIAEANFQAEREMQEQIKKQMEQKALKLQELTAKRVADYKAKKREQARKEKEAKEQALAIKREKEQEAKSEEYIQKMQARMVETEQRLQRRKKEQEDMKHLQELLEKEKLRELAAARQRTENTQSYVKPPTSSTSASPERSAAQPAKKNLKLPKLNLKGQSQHDDKKQLSSGRDRVVVTVGVSGQHRRALQSPRSSKSQQSSRADLKPSRPLRKAKSSLGRETSAQSSSARSEPDQPSSPPDHHHPHYHHHNNNEEGNNEDEESLSDDSLTRNSPEKRPSRPPPGPSRERSFIPTFHGAPRAAEVDTSSCVSALTDDLSLSTFSRANPPSQEHSQASQEPRKRVKKRKEVWKMKPIETSAYVPIPQESGGVEKR